MVIVKEPKIYFMRVIGRWSNPNIVQYFYNLKNIKVKMNNHKILTPNMTPHII